MESERFEKKENNIMENLELTNEMIEGSTTKKSKGLIVGMLIAATAAVGTFIYKKIKKNKAEQTEQPISDEDVFTDIDNVEI